MVEVARAWIVGLPRALLPPQIVRLGAQTVVYGMRSRDIATIGCHIVQLVRLYNSSDEPLAAISLVLAQLLLELLHEFALEATVAPAN